MGFDIERAESIAKGFEEWIRIGRTTYDDAVKQIKETYREDMVREIIRILKHDIEETKAKCRWALVFDNVEEANRAKKKLSWTRIFPDLQIENKLLWIDKESAEISRQVAGGLIEPWGKPTLTPERVKEEEMSREQIEKILEDAGWERTVGAPVHMIDYQRSKPYNRLIIYPADVKYVTEETLRKLMEETNLALHAEIWLEAKKRFLEREAK